MCDKIPSKEEMEKALVLRTGRKLHEKMAQAAVAICGLGGLGSNIAISLARAGVGKLILMDFDKVDISNLNRQQYKVSQIGEYKTDALTDNLKEIAPYLEIEAHTIFMEEGNYFQLLKEADIICEAFDAAEEKSNLVNFVLENMPEKYLVAASGMAGMGSGNKIVTRRIMKHFYLCGDNESDVSNNIGLTASRVMLCAAHQAHAVLRIIAEQFDV